jgi:hypothetical protein
MQAINNVADVIFTVDDVKQVTESWFQPAQQGKREKQQKLSQTPKKVKTVAANAQNLQRRMNLGQNID